MSTATRILIPPLENGDRLTRVEFERRYDAMPFLKKAELLEGVVYMPSPVRQQGHGEQHSQLLTWAGVYAAGTPGVRSGGNSSLRLDDANEPQPNALLFIDPRCGGNAVIDKQGYITNAPDWIGEVSASTVSYDLHEKLVVYRKFRVSEYLVWRVIDRAIDWFVLKGNEYERLPLVRGLYKSTAFPGLWLDVKAMLKGDLTKVLGVLRKGLASPVHKRFVASLRKRRFPAAHRKR